jgi:transposase-like protein
MKSIDQTVLAIYLSGTNQRRVKAALRPLLKGLPLSKSSVSRLVARLREARETWMRRDLSEEPMAYVYLDGFGVNLRRDGRVVRNPVLVAIGVRETGEKVLLSLRIAGGETTAAWRSFVEDLSARGLKPPVLAMIDGSAGLRAALLSLWPETLVQRCAVHKLRNLLAHAPRHAQEAVKEDFHTPGSPSLRSGSVTKLTNSQKSRQTRDIFERSSGFHAAGKRQFLAPKTLLATPLKATRLPPLP